MIAWALQYDEGTIETTLFDYHDGYQILIFHSKKDEVKFAGSSNYKPVKIEIRILSTTSKT